jgi:hypothetical protein
MSNRPLQPASGEPLCAKSMSADWFRNTTWHDAIGRAFDEKCAKEGTVPSHPGSDAGERQVRAARG